MSNMSYCRFRNTLQDLRDCYEAWEDEASDDEQKAKARMLKLCCQIADAYREDEE